MKELYYAVKYTVNDKTEEIYIFATSREEAVNKAKTKITKQYPNAKNFKCIDWLWETFPLAA